MELIISSSEFLATAELFYFFLSLSNFMSATYCLFVSSVHFMFDFTFLALCKEKDIV